MNDDRVIAVLNRVLAIVYRSLPMYLTDAAPWTHPGDERAAATLENVVTDQRALAKRIGELVLDRHGAIDTGEYPMEYTDTHDLSLDYLVHELIRCQRRDLGRLEACAEELRSDREAQDLAYEAVGMTRAHLEALEDLVAQPA